MKKALYVIFALCVLCPCLFVLAEDNKENTVPVDISGKIVDKDGNVFYGDVTLKIVADIYYTDMTTMYGVGERQEYHELKTSNGIFSWKGKASNVLVSAQKDGYHDNVVRLSKSSKIIKEEDDFPVEIMTEISAKDIVLNLIQKGIPVKLEFTKDAYIPGIKDEESSGKQCGWSFSKRWYFPVDGDVPLDIVISINENNQRTYTMKEPGGFVYCPGLPAFESRPNELYNRFEWMPEAPEDGYVQTICPAEREDKEKGDIYYYFKTPDGKYGKICFSGYIDYYINPDGSRNLEVDKYLFRPPLNPNIEHMPDDNEAYSPDE